MFGVGFLIKNVVKFAVETVFDDSEFAAIVGTGVAIACTCGTSLLDDFAEHGINAIADSGTILDNAETLRHGE